MNYRFRVSERNQNKNALIPVGQTRRFRLKGSRTLRTLKRERERIPLFDPFELGELPSLPDAPKKKKRQKRQKKPKKVREKKYAAYCAELLTKFAAWGRRRISGSSNNALPMFAGALCAALLVGSVSALTVLFHLFGAYHAPYTAWIVPNFLGKEPQTVLAQESETIGDELPWNLIIQYVDHAEIPAGRVISQSPAAGVRRRLYRGEDYCNITLTVSRGRPSYTLTDLKGASKRDACLLLQNQGIRVSIREIDVADTPADTVLQTFPAAGATLYAGDQVVLQISKSIRMPEVSVPSLIGLTEAQASTLLRAKGLSVGTISYANSSRPVGTVIAQMPVASGEIAEGSSVSFTVSLGQSISLRTVPNLCGLSYADAVARLREHGLVVGSLSSLANAAPRGTVIEQIPAAGTPITSSTVSVDLYLSS